MKKIASWVKKSIYFGLLLLLALGFCQPVNAAPPANFQTTSIIRSGLNGPSGFDFAPDGRIFILERTGKVKIVKNGSLLATPFVELPVMATGDRGLIGITFDPDFQNNKFVYFYYTGTDLLNKLVRFKADSDVASGGQFLLYETKSPSEQLHVGGSVGFGPDGKLYLAIGDNGYPPNSQDLSNPHGKILRLNKDGTIPTDNPFYNQPGKLGEIWAYGLRNPWRFQFDSATGNLYDGDVGNYTWEEVNKIVKGGNYGWPTAEGVCSNCNFVNPIFAYNHDNQSSAITGGPVYRGSLFPTEYRGSYFFGDYARGFIKRLTLDQNGNSIGVYDFDLNAGSVVDLKVGPDGALYYITYYPGALYRIGYTLGNSTPIANASADKTKGVEPMTVNFSSAGSYDPDGSQLTYLWNFGDNTTSTSPNPAKTYTVKGTYNVTLKVSDGVNSGTSVPLVIQVGTPPTLTIGAPVDGALYRAGDTINYTAFASDGAGFDINDQNIKTEILFHHGTHLHPFLGPLSGRTGSFTVPTSNHESAPDTYFEIKVTATDSNGLATTKSVFVYPRKSQITFSSLVSGLKIFVDGIPTATTTTITGVVGYLRELSAPAIQELNGKLYQFNGWADNGSWKRIISAADYNTNYTANFIEVSGFKAEFFNNANVSGTPVLTRVDNIINFEWFDAAPAAGVNTDLFSVRWSKKQNFAAGKYTFTTTTDDGVRLFIDGALVIDKWVDQGMTSYPATVDLTAGEHEIKMEYYDKVGWATAKLDWQFVSNISGSSEDYQIEYFDNKDLAGQPKFLDKAANLKFNYQGGSPNPQIPNDNFSARFKKTTNLSAGNYQFKILADDGVRVFIDGELVLDKWINQPPTAYTFIKALNGGTHNIVVEYYEGAGSAVLEFSYQQSSVSPTPTPTPTTQPTPTPTPTPAAFFEAKYWNLTAGFTNPTIPTSTPTLTRNDAEINFNWGAGSPTTQITANNFIVSWKRNINFENANYLFKTVSDDGMRVYLDNQIIIDEWTDHAAKDVNVTKSVTAGIHEIRVEYYEKSGDAVAKFSFEKSSATPTPTPTATPVPTDFVGQYFNNINLSGTPVLTKNSALINFKWGNQSPDPLIGVNGFSVRWTKSQNFAAGNYQFSVVADDGVRLFVDGELLVDKWINQPPTEYKVSKVLTAGMHTIVMEYYENLGDATAILNYNIQ